MENAITVLSLSLWLLTCVLVVDCNFLYLTIFLRTDNLFYAFISLSISHLGNSVIHTYLNLIKFHPLKKCLCGALVLPLTNREMEAQRIQTESPISRQRGSSSCRKRKTTLKEKKCEFFSASQNSTASLKRNRIKVFGKGSPATVIYFPWKLNRRHHLRSQSFLKGELAISASLGK